jgi:hypothetical protein
MTAASVRTVADHALSDGLASLCHLHAAADIGNEQVRSAKQVKRGDLLFWSAIYEGGGLTACGDRDVTFRVAVGAGRSSLLTAQSANSGSISLAAQRSARLGRQPYAPGERVSITVIAPTS